MLVYKSVDCTCGFVVINAFNDSNKEIFVYILHRDVYYAIASELNVLKPLILTTTVHAAMEHN